MKLETHKNEKELTKHEQKHASCSMLHVPSLKNVSRSSGFVALFAVLIASMVLLMALGISNIAFKEQVLTAAAKESQYSFFSADTGAECALYFDMKDTFPDNNTGIVQCNGTTPITAISGAISQITDFEFDVSNADNDGCAKVKVDKAHDKVHLDGSPFLDANGNQVIETEIISRGYNVSCANTLTNNPRIVERVLRVSYDNGI